MLNFKLPVALALCASVVGGASAYAMDDKMMNDNMMSMSDPAMMKPMMDKMMMAPMSKSDKMMMMEMMAMGAGERRVMLMTSPLAPNAGLQNASGFADIDVAGGRVEFAVMLPAGQSLPAGSALEGWVVTAGSKGGPGPSTASDADQKYGPAFGMAELSKSVREVPYALSTGLLRRIGDTQVYYGRFMIDNPLTPYAAAVVTLESDGNTGIYDPRPGTPVLMGKIAGGMMMGKDGKMMMMGDGMMGDKMMMGARVMMMAPDGRLMAMQLYKGKMMMSMPNKTMVEIKMRNGQMVMPNGTMAGKLVMVMPDGTQREVMMQNGKMMMMEPGGTMSEIMMMP